MLILTFYQLLNTYLVLKFNHLFFSKLGRQYFSPCLEQSAKPQNLLAFLPIECHCLSQQVELKLVGNPCAGEFFSALRKTHALQKHT